MTKRISWKKGMRLTDEVLLASDRCTAQAVSQSLTLASAGRFGLLPSLRPFQVSLNVASHSVEVTSLSLTAITRAGDVIDLQSDNNQIHKFNNNLSLPDGEAEMFLTIEVEPETWQDTDDGCMEQSYHFELVTSQTALSDHAMPIAHLVREGNAWAEDNTRFAPPAIYISAHHRYMELCTQLVDVLKEIHEKTKPHAQSPVKTAISIYWPIVLDTLIQVNTSSEMMTPAMLLACIQKVAGGFALACDVDSVLNLEDAPLFYSFAQVPYDYQKGFLRIRQGIGMCRAISEKVDKFSLLNAAPPPPPTPEPRPEPKPDPRRSWLGKQI